MVDTLKPANFSWRDLLAQKVADAFGMLGAENSTQRSIAQKARQGIDFLPLVGDAVGVDDTARALERGDYGEAAVSGAQTAVGAVPGLGDALAAASKAIFLGPSARTANIDQWFKAQDMVDEGASRVRTAQETGWFPGLDKRWRNELSDHRATLGPYWDYERMQNLQPAEVPFEGIALSEALNFPEFFEAYPRAKDLPVIADYGSKGGYYSTQASGNSHIGIDAPGVWELQQTNPDAAMRDPLSVLLHEAQHYIQDIEGFSQGGNPQDIFAGNISTQGTPEAKIYEEFLQKVPVRTANDPRFFNAENIQSLTRARQEAAHEIYKRLAGETEARNVQTRMHFTPEERVAVPPQFTADYPLFDQILAEDLWRRIRAKP